MIKKNKITNGIFLKNIITFFLILNITFITVININYNLVKVYAETEETDEESEPDENEIAQTFYRPKSAFRSSIEYENYCSDMYNHGYMDENYEWTSLAQSYIDNPTIEGYDKLDSEARALVNERVESGKMKKSDSPYLSYEEYQQAIKEESSSENTTTTITPTSPTDGSENIIDEDLNGDNISQEVNEENETSQSEMNTEQHSSEQSTSHIITIILIMAVGLIIVLGGYYIYKRQF